MRFANVIQALSEIGDLDLVTFTARDPGVDIPSSLRLRTHRHLRRPDRRLALSARLRWLVVPSIPLELAGRDYGAIRSVVSELLDEHADLLWLSRVESFIAVHAGSRVPAILDLDDLEDDKIEGRMSTLREDSMVHVTERIRRSAVQFQARRNRSAWSRSQRDAASSVDVAVVCSADDRQRLAARRSAVIANGYTAPLRPLGRISVRPTPTILMQGYLQYPPNVDAATYFVHEIFPLIKDALGDVELRLVGRSDERVEHLSGEHGVVVTGWVPEIESELSQADLIVAPIRFGGGTRIKVLEGFAHRIPIVSTRIGAHGLDVLDGQHLRLADTPRDFADACVQLLTEETDRRRMVAAAHELFLEKYQWDGIRDEIKSLAVSVAGAGR